MTPRRIAGAPKGSLAVTLVGGRAKPRAASGLATWLARAAPARVRGSVVIALVSDGRMRQLNARFRGVDHSTDVLSFPEAPAIQAAGKSRKPNSSNHLGEIAIGLGVARRQARDLGHGLDVELRVLVLHGFLHLLGYDHDRDHGEMRRAEDRLRRRAGLPSGLISRTSPRTKRP